MRALDGNPVGPAVLRVVVCETQENDRIPSRVSFLNAGYVQGVRDVRVGTVVACETQENDRIPSRVSFLNAGYG